MFSAGSTPMAVHATMETTMRSSVIYPVRAKGLLAGQSLELSGVVGYLSDQTDINKGHHQGPLPGNDQ
jgi:hypothetical protein